MNGRGQWLLWWRWCNRECVGCDEDREYGNAKRMRGMKSVWRKTVSSQIQKPRFLADRLGIMGLVVGRDMEGLTILGVC